LSAYCLSPVKESFCQIRHPKEDQYRLLIILIPTSQLVSQLVGWWPDIQATVQMGSLYASEKYDHSALGEYSIIRRALEWKL